MNFNVLMGMLIFDMLLLHPFTIEILRILLKSFHTPWNEENPTIAMKSAAITKTIMPTTM